VINEVSMVSLEFNFDISCQLGRAKAGDRGTSVLFLYVLMTHPLSLSLSLSLFLSSVYQLYNRMVV
jgi:hypothetical protein